MLSSNCVQAQDPFCGSDCFECQHTAQRLKSWQQRASAGSVSVTKSMSKQRQIERINSCEYMYAFTSNYVRTLHYIALQAPCGAGGD